MWKDSKFTETSDKLSSEMQKKHSKLLSTGVSLNFILIFLCTIHTAIDFECVLALPKGFQLLLGRPFVIGRWWCCCRGHSNPHTRPCRDCSGSVRICGRRFVGHVLMLLAVPRQVEIVVHLVLSSLHFISHAFSVAALLTGIVLVVGIGKLLLCRTVIVLMMLCLCGIFFISLMINVVFDHFLFIIHFHTDPGHHFE